MSFYGGQRLRVGEYASNPKICIQDALNTISHDSFVKADFRKLLIAMLTHAPTERGKASIAGNILSLRGEVEKSYYAQVGAGVTGEAL